MTSDIPTNAADLRIQAAQLRLHGLLAHWSELMAKPEHALRVTKWLVWEAEERGRRSPERRAHDEQIGRFKAAADFDGTWPKPVDRAAVEELMTPDFLAEANNAVLVGPNGVVKTICACNLGYWTVLARHTALFVTAGQLLGDLAALDSGSALRRGLRHCAAPDLLVVDEVDYLTYSNQQADLLFELVSRRYQNKSTVITSIRAFAEWGEGFPNAACGVPLVDRLMHPAEVVRLEGES